MTGLEASFVILFALDMVLHAIGYGYLYMKECLHMVDAFLMLLYVGLLITESQLSGVDQLKWRGILRIVRVIVILRRFDVVTQKLRRRAKLNQYSATPKSNEVQTVEERVVRGLQEVLSRIDKNDAAVDHLEYAIKQITSYNLYEGLDLSDESDVEQSDSMLSEDLDDEVMENQNEDSSIPRQL